MKWRVICGYSDGFKAWVEANTEDEAKLKGKEEFLRWLDGDCFYAESERDYKAREAADIEFENRGYK